MTKYAHYRPHKRVTFDGKWTNPHTGEIVALPSMTKQEFKRECDINNIIKQFSTTGMLNHVSANAKLGAYLHLPDSYDFQESLETVAQAEKAFMTLPSKLRERFDNEPSKFLAFAGDPKNLDEMRTLGLANPAPPKPEAPPVAKPSSDPPPKG